MKRRGMRGKGASRIETTLNALRQAGRKALIPYITAGDPHPRYTVSLMHALVNGGADVIELGVPFSDPMADGPTIQRACERALQHGTSLHGVLEMVTRFRETDAKTPIVLMGYLNPIEVFGLDAFVSAARYAGVDGVLVVDLPVEEAFEFSGLMRSQGLDTVFLLAPTSNDNRIREVVRLATGYLYYVSLKGVTGSNLIDVASIASKLEQIRRYSNLPIAVGFGIRNAETAALVASVADAVVVGSALVSAIESGLSNPSELEGRLSSTLLPIRQALNSLQ